MKESAIGLTAVPARVEEAAIALGLRSAGRHPLLYLLGEGEHSWGGARRGAWGTGRAPRCACALAAPSFAAFSTGAVALATAALATAAATGGWVAVALERGVVTPPATG